MDCDAESAGNNSFYVGLEQTPQRPQKITASMHADLLDDVLKSPFPCSAVMHVKTRQGQKPLGFIYQTRLMKNAFEAGCIPTKKECQDYMYHPVFITAISEISPSQSLKKMIADIDSTYFDRFTLKDRRKNYL